MQMTKSQVRFRNEVNDLTYQAVVKMHKRKLKSNQKKVNYIDFRKVKLPLIVIIVLLLFFNLLPFSKSSVGSIYKEKFLSKLGKEIASISTSSDYGTKKITVLFLFNKNNKRYKPLAEALVAELNRKLLITNTEYPLDFRGLDEDEFKNHVDSAIWNNRKSDILMIISAGGVNFLEKCNSLDNFLESGKRVVVLGNLSMNNKLINMLDNKNIVIISRKKGWLKPESGITVKTEKFLSSEYLIIKSI